MPISTSEQLNDVTAVTFEPSSSCLSALDSGLGTRLGQGKISEAIVYLFRVIIVATLFQCA
jgi:hypothetical protein